MRRAPPIVLTVLFLGLVVGVPVTQSILDVREDERPQVAELFEEAPTEEHLRAFEEALEEHSFFESLLRPKLQLLRYLTTRDLGEKAVAGRDGWYFYSPGLKYLAQPYFREVVPSLRQDGDPVLVIADVAAKLQERGIELLVVPVPGKASIYPERLTGRLEPEIEVFGNTRRLAQELRQRGVKVLLLHDVFRAHRRAAGWQEEPLYMASDTHWTGEGARLAASALGSWVAARSWFRKAQALRYRRRQVTLRRWGDVLKMTQIPLQELLFDGEQVTCHQVVDRVTGKLYADDPASPILLLGDSFSRVFHTDEPEAAGLIANLAYELQTPLTTLVNDGGASTLVRQGLARDPELLRGKRLVIWEFIERDVRFGLRGWQEVPLPEAPTAAASGPASSPTSASAPSSASSPASRSVEAR